jgi:hypothetical protein
MMFQYGPALFGVNLLYWDMLSRDMLIWPNSGQK